MGISVFVEVEKESEPPVRERTDGKALADIVAGWIWYPNIVDLVGLSDASEEALQRVEMSDLEPYTDPKKKPEAKDVWQNPEVVRAALEELREIFRRMSSNPSLIEDMEMRAQDN